MKTHPFENLMILIGSIAFYMLFWNEKMGLNVLLFDVLIIAFILSRTPEVIRYRSVALTLAGTLVTALLIVWNNSLFVKVIHLLSFGAMVGFVKQSELRFLGYGFLLFLISCGETPAKLFQKIVRPRSNNNGSFKLRPVWRSFRLSVVPLLVLLLFYAIYHVANPEFRALSNDFWSGILDLFSWDISLPQVLFFLFGLLCIAAVLIQSDFPIFKNLQKNHRIQLVRQKGTYLSRFRSMIALKNEYQSGLILLVALNLLLLIVNCLDIKNYWFSSVEKLPPIEMKAMVHEGTYLLITALIMAMIVISFFFRKNLNFFPKNQTLKTLAYCWIAQNAVLAITVFIKNYRYIEYTGLAYKRIGVLIFLTLVFAGLITMIIKVKTLKTFYYLLQTNAWIAYTVLILCSFVNWDILITNYNLNQQYKYDIDYDFLLYDVSDKNVYLLMERAEQNLLPELTGPSLVHSIDKKKKAFIQKQARLSWLSWNYADHRNLTHIEDEH